VIPVAHSLTAEGHDASEDGTGRGTPLVPLVADTLTGGNPGGRSHGKKSGTDRMTMIPIAFSSKDSGADATNDLAPTLRAMNYAESHINGGGQVAIAFTERTRAEGRNVEAQADLAYPVRDGGAGTASKGAVVTPAMAVRRLLPVECCRLQGFPDWWLDDLGLSDSAKYRMLGNAVCVPVAEWIARRLA
jgi:DNA (cytosine-5)-methyltransferase 1